MRIKCNICGGPATIQSSNQIGSVKDLYCTCNDPECGHSFVMSLSFSHTISPSAKTFPAEFLEKFRKSNQAQQRELLRALAS